MRGGERRPLERDLGSDHDGSIRAGVYLDHYARAGKRSGAWMDVCRSRLSDGEALHRPVAYLTCNFPPPTGGGEPALLTHDDVVTLFHEFGHGLKQVLENEAGDFIYIKPDVPHEVFNMSDTEPVVAFVARSSADEWDNIIPYDRNQPGDR